MSAPSAFDGERLLAVARDAAGAASRIAHQGWLQRDSIEVADKGAGDVVTSIDLAAETAAIGIIRSECPDHAILSEEAGGDGVESDYLWVIDPIDGSVNFAHGLADFAVSVACLHRGQALVGVIVDPVRGDTYSAIRHGGAWRNGSPIRVSSCSALKYALLGTVFPKPGAPAMAGYLPALGAALNTAQGVRRSGSMVLDLARVASGQLDGFWQVGMKAWDLAAGSLMIEEAGGRLDLRGAQNTGPTASVLDTRSCIAAAPDLLEALARLLDGFDGESRRT
ncbi:MAG: inositol monophosphatase [Azoarcus sp. PHD]|nr:MAG: inositol monophosphatase [Azoarcus sp. PHD]